MPPLPNQRQERFSQELAKGRTQGQAYAIAGYRYTESNHGGNASRLSENERVKARIKELSAPVAVKTQVTVESMIRELDEDIALAREHAQMGAAVSARALKAKLAGLLIDRKEVGTPGEFESMRADELAAALVKLLHEHGLSVVEDDAEPAMIDVTPGEATE